MPPVRRVTIIATCSGQGKTTLGRRLADSLGVDFIELDGWVHGPNWAETPDAELIARLEPVLARDAWVIDGFYSHKLGTRTLDRADLVIWLDLPARVWLPRLLRRTLKRIVWREELWNGNRESWRGAFWGRDSLFGFVLSSAGARRRRWPEELAAFPVRRLRSDAEALALLQDLTHPGAVATQRGAE